MTNLDIAKFSTMSIDEKLNTIMQHIDKIENKLNIKRETTFEKCKEEQPCIEKPTKFNRAKRELIIQTIDKHKGNITKACLELEISRATVYRYLKK